MTQPTGSQPTEHHPMSDDLVQTLFDLQVFRVHGTAQPQSDGLTWAVRPSELAVMLADAAARVASFGDHAMPDGTALIAHFAITVCGVVDAGRADRAVVADDDRVLLINRLAGSILPGVRPEREPLRGATLYTARGATAAGLTITVQDGVTPTIADMAAARKATP